jgi:hypothetical protein
MNPRRADFDRFVADGTASLLRTAYLIVWASARPRTSCRRRCSVARR